MTPKNVCLQKSFWVSKDAEFYAEFNSAKKNCKKAAMIKVISQNLFDLLNKS